MGDLGATRCGNVLAAVSKESCTVVLNQGAAFGSPDMPYTPKEYGISGLGVDANKQARVTIDAGPPTSTVVALPAESGRAFLIQWPGQDDVGGSGIESCDIFASTNGGPFGVWIKETTVNSALFIGELGNTYAFYSIARDLVGNVEAAPVSPDAQTLVITDAPLLVAVTNQVAGVASDLFITNVVAGTAVGFFTFSLGLDSPFDAAVDPTNGVFHWRPGCAYGSTTNQVTVWVTDSARTNISDAMTFTVVVGECVQPQLGRLVLGAGETGRLPINLISTVALTNVSMIVTVPPERLTNLNVEPIAPEICTNAAIAALTNGLYAVAFATCSNQWLIGTQQVAWLHVTAVPHQSSAFVPVTIGDLLGVQPDGTVVSNLFAQGGRVVIVGEEPLLEALRSTNGLVQLLLYAQPETTNILQAASMLPAEGLWSAQQQVTMTNLLQSLPPLPATNRMLFFRALRQ